MGRKEDSEKEATAVRGTSAPGPVSEPGAWSLEPGEALLKALGFSSHLQQLPRVLCLGQEQPIWAGVQLCPAAQL